ncbi:ornithine carbamoyltransferase [Spirochaeta lutea]|uniref:Ornithine carbamoyltransferase n=1 Tax=Spirochaeta lutea TaxID=1480694 RepID=A0A098QXK8_9SPIO|nr:ornithine carbamoyltransferase [Spirochaeta lutea]KGE72409.1 ornithine carbamoyltransferase [Spirochaeta lutea]
MKGRSLLTLRDFSAEEIRGLLELSQRVSHERKQGIRSSRFTGHTLAIVFEKLSTRTRSAFETAFGEEGGYPVFLSPQDIHLGVKESLEDTARVLGRMFDAIAFRGFKQSTAETLASFSGVPVINGLTDLYHPTQALADMLTIQQEFGKLEGLKVCYVGDGRNNVAHSLLIICAKLGVHFTCIAPQELMPPEEWVEGSRALAVATGATQEITSEIDAIQGADVVYTDVWVSMGEEAEKELREQLLAPFQVTQNLMTKTGKQQSIFLHCLPAVKGKEVEEQVFEGPQSRVWDQAENRKHTIKAALMAFLGLVD